MLRHIPSFDRSNVKCDEGKKKEKEKKKQAKENDFNTPWPCRSIFEMYPFNKNRQEKPEAPKIICTDFKQSRK